MFRFLVIALCCLASPVFGYSKGAPTNVCSNGLTPEHGKPGRTDPVPYSFSGANGVKAGNAVTITLAGDSFKGLAIQAHDASGQPVGSFKNIDSKHSQTLTCSHNADTLTHKKIESPIKKLEFQWIAPANYKNKVTLVGTVAKDGGNYWIRAVKKEITVQ